MGRPPDGIVDHRPVVEKPRPSEEQYTAREIRPKIQPVALHLRLNHLEVLSAIHSTVPMMCRNR